MTNEAKNELTYQIILDAINGNSEAEELIFTYYEPYIIKLSKIHVISTNGKIRYVIDEDIYMSLKLKLHELILEYEIT